MAEDLTDQSELEEPTEELDTEKGQPRRGLSTRAIVAIAVAVALVAGGAFWALSWYSTSGERDIAAQRQALAKSWKEAQSDAAQGVDFDLKISNGNLDSKPSLSFDHEGLVTAKDSCFEATSEYIVRADGSLAIQDLTGSWQTEENLSCSDAEPSSIFWTSKVSFNMETSDSWTAYGADGKSLVPELKEKRIIAEIETDDDSELSEDTP